MVLLLALGVCLALPVAVQAQTATLEGRVIDPQDAAIVGATVTVTSPMLRAPVIAISDRTGGYRFASLVPGAYRVTFAIPGFQQQQYDGIVVRAGAVRVLSVQLVLAPLVQRVDVVGVAPLLGAGVRRDRLPAAVSVVESGDLEERGAPSLPDALNERLGSISLAGTTTNLFQPTLRFRGFTASSLLGLPQGIAVYQNGVRINEPFGDTVQFDLVPQFAIDRIQLSAGADPTYGLNALGGALALRLKNGFDNAGFRGELSGGSFGRLTATAQFGADRGPWAFYLGAMRFEESGWRVASPSEVTQAVADVGYRRGSVDAGASFTYADTRLNGNGPAPVELLAVDRGAVFTFPDTTENRLAFGQGRFNVAVSPVWSVQVTGYYRDLDRRTVNGDEAEFTLCDDDVLPPGAPVNTLCAGAAGADDGADGADATGSTRAADTGGDDGADDGGAEPEAAPLVDVRTGRFITDDDAEGDGAFNRTATRAKGYGAAVQAMVTTDLAARDNVLVLGASADLADVAFVFNSEVGTLTPARTVAGSGLFAGIFPEAPDDLLNTDIDTENRAFGLYFTDTFSLTDRVHLTVSGRYNDVSVEITDRLGTSLDGRHAFSRFNPGVGAVYQITATTAVFARYTESNRVPTAAELSCADPAEPCRVPNAFVSDPSLEQAVARSVEGGARGRQVISVGEVEWAVTVYRTRIRDDILFVGSPDLIGTGFFQNAGDTQRVGLDLELSGNVSRLGWFASYTWVEATFESPLLLPSNPIVNDAADDDGMLRVEPGDRLPGIPRHSLKGGVRYDVTEAWNLAVETVVASSRIFFGDEGNDQAELDGYGVVNLRSSYRFGENLELFVRVDNLFDAEYATFGVLAELEIDLHEVPDASDPRFVAPGAPRSAFAGVRLRF